MFQLWENTPPPGCGNLSLYNKPFFWLVSVPRSKNCKILLAITVTGQLWWKAINPTPTFCYGATPYRWGLNFGILQYIIISKNVHFPLFTLLSRRAYLRITRLDTLVNRWRQKKLDSDSYVSGTGYGTTIKTKLSVPEPSSVSGTNIQFITKDLPQNKSNGNYAPTG